MEGKFVHSSKTVRKVSEVERRRVTTKLSLMQPRRAITDRDRLEVFRRLIAFDTTSANSNVSAANDLASFLEDHGCRVDRFESDDGQKVNLVAHKGPECEGGLLLSGHLDVVPATEDGWDSDPFTLTEHDDRYVARGSADMKGFVALAACLLADIDASPMKTPLVGLFTHDEEVGTIGAQQFCRQWDQRYPLPSAGIIGEPTELSVVRMHKGHTKLRIDVTGTPAHSGYPHLGSNAIEKLGYVIGALTSLRKEFEARRCDSSKYYPQTPYIVLNQAVVEGGVAVNIIPGACSLTLGIRVLPGQSSTEAIEAVRRAIQAETDLADDVSISLIGDSPPLLTDASAEVNRRLCAHVGQTDTAAVSYASDAGPLATMGVDCVLYGPGSIEVAHKPNEYVPKDQLQRAWESLSGFTSKWCID
ncbi:MAG: acetylornithine deacetylase [Phycisphaerae bacterium]|nr:MAG: acetylornithine deacetylase [Phycisphaerae bacterium]